jgi:N-acetylglutamate synthase-like GNAT family acetyltransferase
MRIEIRRAHPEEADTLTEIAHAAKRHWNYPESWIQQWQSDLTITREFIATHEVFAAIINGEIAGCCALVVTDSLAEIEHMWISPARMGSGAGRALFEQARARAVERGANVLELSADPNAEGFYARMGAKRIGEVVADMDGERRVLPRMRIELSNLCVVLGTLCFVLGRVAQL